MKLSLTLLAIVLGSIGSISGSPAPSSPQSGLKQLTREQLVRRFESKHLQRRAVPKPSNKGYYSCGVDGDTGTTLFAIFSATDNTGGTFIGSSTEVSPYECSQACAANPACFSSVAFTDASLFTCQQFSSVGSLQQNFYGDTAVRGSCADAIANSNYVSSFADCCEQRF